MKRSLVRNRPTRRFIEYVNAGRGIALQEEEEEEESAK
jgi:hypothetical protein